MRTVYPGTLAMMYPSWGIRPGQVDLAIESDLEGSTNPEINGELQRGFDFERFVAGIRDQRVALYTTWLEAPFGDDTSSDPADWTPGHYLAHLASAKDLEVWGETSGQNSYADMQRCFERMQQFNIRVLMWAFHGQLKGGRYATMEQYAELIGRMRSSPQLNSSLVLWLPIVRAAPVQPVPSGRSASRKDSFA